MFTDLLTEVLRGGARALLTQAVEAEVADFLHRHSDLKTDAGRRRVVRHGHLPEREIMTGIGPVGVRQPRIRDREAAEGERIRYSPSILPPYARRSKSLEVLIPILYLKGISSGDFSEALAALFGTDAPGLSAATISRLKKAWIEEHARWQQRNLRQSSMSISGSTAFIWRCDSGRGAVHPGHHRRDAGGQEGARRLHRRLSREPSNRGMSCCSI